MRDADSKKRLKLALARQDTHSFAMRRADRDLILCIARHPITAEGIWYEVCVQFCEKCRTMTRLIKVAGYLPVKVQRISRGAEAATPAASETLPESASP